MHLRLGACSGMKVLLLAGLRRHRWDSAATVIEFVLHARVRERWHPRHLLLLLTLCHHVFPHAYELLDQELEDRVLILSVQLGQFLKLGDLNHIRILLQLFLLNHPLLLRKEHLLLPDDLAVLSFNELFVLHFLVLDGLLHHFEGLLGLGATGDLHR